jgi:hypothetical protein
MLPPDVILLLRQVESSGFAPLDLMAADLLKKYTQQVGPSEYKTYETWAIPPELETDAHG